MADVGRQRAKQGLAPDGHDACRVQWFDVVGVLGQDTVGGRVGLSAEKLAAYMHLDDGTRLASNPLLLLVRALADIMYEGHGITFASALPSNWVSCQTLGPPLDGWGDVGVGPECRYLAYFDGHLDGALHMYTSNLTKVGQQACALP